MPKPKKLTAVQHTMEVADLKVVIVDDGETETRVRLSGTIWGRKFHGEIVTDESDELNALLKKA
jgi:hypothetical protein